MAKDPKEPKVVAEEAEKTETAAEMVPKAQFDKLAALAENVISQNNDLNTRLEALEKGEKVEEGNKRLYDKRKKISIRFYASPHDEKTLLPIIGFVNQSRMNGRFEYIYEEQDPKIPTKMNQYVDLILGDEAKTVVKGVLYSKFMQDQTYRRWVPVVSENVEKLVEEHGEVERIEYKEYKRIETGEAVPLEVESERRKFIVELEDKSQLTIDERFINF